MKINEITKGMIKPGIHSSPNESRDKIVNFIKKNCSQILYSYEQHNKFLYHGVDNILSCREVIFGKQKNGRKPLGTDINIHNKLNTILRKCGFKSVRSNSIFCISNIWLAEEFGEIFVIFPLNGFNYSWCRSAIDLTVEFDISSRPYKSVKNNEFYRDMKSINPQEFVKKYEFENNIGFADALKFGNEILINGSYVGIKHNSPIIKMLFPEYKSDIDHMEQDYTEIETKEPSDEGGWDDPLGESASCGGTSSGGIATVNGTNTPPKGQFFGGDPNSSVYGPIKKNRRKRKNVTPRV